VIIPAATLSSFRFSANETTATNEGNVRLAPNGNLVLQYRLPTQAALQPTRVSVLLKSGRDQRNFRQSDPQLEIYNWEQQKWDVISNTGDNRERIDLTGPNLGAYVDRFGGFVRLRASTKSEVYILQQLNVELEGSKQ